MIHRDCEGCKHFKTGSLINSWKVDRTKFLKTRCDYCFSWHVRNSTRRLWEKKGSRKMYTCEGCTLQTHDEMDDWILGELVNGGIDNMCGNCIRKGFVSADNPKIHRICYVKWSKP